LLRIFNSVFLFLPASSRYPGPGNRMSLSLPLKGLEERTQAVLKKQKIQFFRKTVALKANSVLIHLNKVKVLFSLIKKIIRFI
jgi:hypothetical protein